MLPTSTTSSYHLWLSSAFPINRSSKKHARQALQAEIGTYRSNQLPTISAVLCGTHVAEWTFLNIAPWAICQSVCLTAAIDHWQSADPWVNTKMSWALSQTVATKNAGQEALPVISGTATALLRPDLPL